MDVKRRSLWVCGLLTLALSACQITGNLGDDGVDGGSGGSGGDGDGDGDGAGGAPSADIVIFPVGAAGATLEATGAVIVVPAGALDKEVDLGVHQLEAKQVTAQVGDDIAGAKPASLLYVLTPHGTQFTKDVSVQLEHNGKGNAVVRLDDEDDPDWEIVPNAKFGGGKVDFVIRSFSVYAVIEITCAEGEVLVDGACVVEDPCAVDNGGCGDPAFVVCEAAGAEANCVDIDECATDNGGCGDPTYNQCVDNVGQDPSCVDIDECATDNGGCGGPRYFTCQNLQGAPPTCTPTGITLITKPPGTWYDLNADSQMDILVDWNGDPGAYVSPDGEINLLATVRAVAFDAVDICKATQQISYNYYDVTFDGSTVVLVYNNSINGYYKLNFLSADPNSVSFEYARVLGDPALCQ